MAAGVKLLLGETPAPGPRANAESVDDWSHMECWIQPVKLGRRSSASAELGVEEGEDLRPQVRGEGLIERPEGVVGTHERVARSWMDGQRHILSHAPQLGFQGARGLGPEEPVVLGHIPLHRCGEPGPVGLGVTLRKPVEGNGRLDPVAAVRGDHEPRASHPYRSPPRRVHGT